MKYCKTCKIKYNTPINKCLFCSNDLKSLDNNIIKYKFPEIKKEPFKKTKIFKMILLAIIFAIAICLYLDFTYKNDFHWSLVVLCTSLTLYFLMLNIFFEKRKIRMIITIMLLIIVEIFAMGFIFGSYEWAIDYVLPFSLMATICFITMVLFIVKLSWHDYSIYLFCLSILGLLPLLFNILNITVIKWPSFITFIFSAIVLIGMMFLADKSSKEEFKRRFHF